MATAAFAGPVGYQEVPTLRSTSVPEPEPQIPLLDGLGKIPGYEKITFNDACQAPPNQETANQNSQEITSTDQSIPGLTEEDVRAALVTFVDQNCCYGRRSARRLKINDIVHKGATHYTLETFGERRSVSWAYEPFGGQALVSTGGGPVPLPWDIPVSSPQGPFCSCTTTTEVPNTAQVHVCHRCLGLGHIMCESCGGRGKTTCFVCLGNKVYNDRRHHQNHYQSCGNCMATGYESCAKCTGLGHVQCKICCGLRQLKYFIRLTVVWANHVGNNVSDTGPFPRELILDAQGATVYEAQSLRVSPITHIPGNFVNAASTALIMKHCYFKDERILQQRHRVRMVRVAEIQYTMDHKEGIFYVYSFDNKVHFPDYPRNCCFCCCCLGDACQIL